MSKDLDARALLDPEIAEFLGASPLDFGALLGGLSDDNVGEVRRMFAELPELPVSDEVLRTDHVVDESTGVAVRVHRPADADGAVPCLYWMHAGGLVIGSNRGDDARFDEWCRTLGCAGVSVEYRLAPEVAFPGAIEDAHAGLAWVHAHAAELGIDPERIGVGGASAGGGLAAALALMARDRGEVPVAFQLLIYPMLDDRQVTSSSHWDDPIWPPSANRYAWTAYLGDARGGADVSPYAAPARATDLAGLPPALISVGALDGFSDENIEYAVRLRHAGVPVELHVYAGAPHGFDSLVPDAAIAKRARRDVLDWLTPFLHVALTRPDGRVSAT